MVLNNFVDNVKQKNKNGYIYISTSKSYARINNFKLGKTENLIGRLSSFNTSQNSQDLCYICFYEKVFDVSRVEKLLHSLLEDFVDNKDKASSCIITTFWSW